MNGNPSRRQWLAQSGCIITAAAGLHQRCHAANPRVAQLGTRRELFIDDALIERQQRVSLRLHHPRETSDVFVHDRPWEGNRSMYHTMFQDGNIYRLYYRGSQIDILKGRYGIPYNVTCYAESKDGIHWTRPNLGMVRFRGSKKNNIILSGEQCHAFVPFKDENPQCPPQHRYKAIVAIYKPKRGLHVYSSPDGLRWSPIKKQAVITEGYFDSQNLAFWDSVRKQYVCFYRALRGGPGQLRPPTHKGSTKDVMVATSADFIHWTKPQWLKYTPQRWHRVIRNKTETSPYVQLYTSQVQAYHRAPHIYLGFPTRYVEGRAKLGGLNRRLARSVDYFGSAYTDTGFMTSRDGRYFKFHSEAFARPGEEAKQRWVYGDNFQALGMLETKGKTHSGHELSMYIGEGFWRQPRLRRYSLRLDGFVSLHAPLSGGEVISKPFSMNGQELRLNVATSVAGRVRAELQDGQGRAIPQFTLNDCTEIFGDDIERRVNWKGGSLARFKGQTLKLRLQLHDANVYAFRFQ